MPGLPVRARVGIGGRRHFCACCAVAAAAVTGTVTLSPREAFAQARGIVDTIRDAAARAPIEVHRLRDGIAVLEGSGGNIAVLPGRDGKLLIDAGISVSRSQLSRALAGLGPEPVTRLVNTHWHFDHTDGNGWFHQEGAIISARPETRRHLFAAQRVEDWDYTFPAAPPGALPSGSLADGETLRHSGATVAFRYYGPAHTDCDLSATFVEANVLHAGDTFWNGVYPFIDYSTGGSVEGMIQAAERNIAGANDETIVVPGHGPIGSRRDLQAFHTMLATVRDNVAALKQGGRSAAECVAARPTAAFDAIWGNFVVSPAFFTRIIYAGV
ncbi:MBL fold metallo-hydrolase (plasmid) [Roseomonas sp. CCTCC AB2023176]|uniref:MBL fold metallo-hydrolase n=1 Tax=Roseomonas sp. CCTCC AB2023176 TaxID=3342640 RepID=UPI0035E24B65